MTQLFVQTVPRHAGWLLVGPPAATSLVPQQDITVTFADGTSVVVPAGAPAALLGGGTTWDRTREVVVGYVLKTAGTLLAAPESQLATISTDYAPLVRVLADSVQVYQTQQAGGGASLVVDHGGTLVGTRPTLNLIDGTGATLTVADNPTSDSVDVTVASSGGSTAAMPSAKAYSVSSTSIAASGALNVPFELTDHDTGTTTAQHSNTVNPEQLVCQQDGVYQVNANAGMSIVSATGAGHIEFYLVLNSTGGSNGQWIAVAYAQVIGGINQWIAVSLSGQATLAVGDYVVLEIDNVTNTANSTSHDAGFHQWPSMAWTRIA